MVGLGQRPACSALPLDISIRAAAWTSVGLRWRAIRAGSARPRAAATCATGTDGGEVVWTGSDADTWTGFDRLIHASRKARPAAMRMREQRIEISLPIRCPCPPA